MKKIKSKNGSTRIRAELSSAVGIKSCGFCENGITELENIIITGEGLRLRDGICLAASIPGEILFAQTLTVQGEAIGFVSDSSSLYAIYPNNSDSYCTAKKVFSHPVSKTNGFLFALGKNAYLCYNNLFYVMKSNGFQRVSSYYPTIYTTGNTISSEQINEHMNLLN